MKGRSVIILVMLISISLFSQEKSAYYAKGDTWQKTVANSIQSFHREWKSMQALLQDDARITLGTWYSVGGFPGERNELHKKKFGPEKNANLNYVYSGSLKWVALYLLRLLDQQVNQSTQLAQVMVLTQHQQLA